MLCSMCQHGVNVRDTHKCDGCGETLCRHLGKFCKTCKPTPPMRYCTDRQTWLPLTAEEIDKAERDARTEFENEHAENIRL